MSLRPSLQQHLFSLLFIMTGITIVIIATIVLPAIRDIVNTKNNTDQTQKFLEYQYNQTAHLRKSITHLSDTQSTLAQLSNATIERGGEVDLIKQFEHLADSNHLAQTLTINASPISTITFSFVIRGTFDNEIRYLRALEMLPQYLLIDTLQWIKEPSSNRLATTKEVTLRFNATMYFTEKK